MRAFPRTPSRRSPTGSWARSSSGNRVRWKPSGLSGRVHRRYLRQDPRRPSRQPARVCCVGVTVDGERDILGLWAGQGGEGAKYWLTLLTEIKNRGVADVCIVCCDGLKGLPYSISARWPLAIVQTCVLHLIRHTFWLAGRLDWDEIGRALRPVYTAPTEAAARERSRRDTSRSTKPRVLGARNRTRFDCTAPIRRPCSRPTSSNRSRRSASQVSERRRWSGSHSARRVLDGVRVVIRVHTERIADGREPHTQRMSRRIRIEECRPDSRLG